MILVTGGTGLVGSHLLVALTQQYDAVKAIYRTEKSLENVKKVFSYYFDDVREHFSKIQWVNADIIDIPSLEAVFVDIKHVYHCAAIVSFNPRDYHKMRKCNIEGTANIVNFSIANGVEKLCFVSSVAAIDKTLKKPLIDESGEWNAEGDHSGYAITKYGGETEVWRGSQEGLDVIIVNPGIILGSGFWNVGSGKMFTKVNEGLKYYPPGTMGFISVKDVAESMLMLMQNPIKNERFILVSENCSYKDIFDRISNSLGKNSPKIKVTKLMSSIVWRISSVLSFVLGKEPILTKHSAKSIHKQYRFSNKKIQNVIPIDFQPIGDAIEEIARVFTLK